LQTYVAAIQEAYEVFVYFLTNSYNQTLITRYFSAYCHLVYVVQT